MSMFYYTHTHDNNHLLDPLAGPLRASMIVRWGYDRTQLVTEGPQITDLSESESGEFLKNDNITMSMDFESCQLCFYQNGTSPPNIPWCPCIGNMVHYMSKYRGRHWHD